MWQTSLSKGCHTQMLYRTLRRPLQQAKVLNTRWAARQCILLHSGPACCVQHTQGLHTLFFKALLPVSHPLIKREPASPIPPARSLSLMTGYGAQVKWGIDLASEHERYLTEKVFDQPLIVYNYPKDIKVQSCNVRATQPGIKRMQLSCSPCKLSKATVSGHLIPPASLSFMENTN